MKNLGDTILLSHGGGGMLTQHLIRNLIQTCFQNPILNQFDDSAVLDLPPGRVVFTTDSYVVQPLFFPGGNIGRLAACGTINDLVMQGAKPLYLSLGLILEEGLMIRDLEQTLQSMAEVLQATGVLLATGDTKVVERGHGHGIFMNTSGIGVQISAENPHVSRAQPGDAVVLSGTMGDHGVAVLSRREGLELQTQLESDVAPLWDLMRPVLESVPAVHVLRDPTRGGVAAALCDIAAASQVEIRLTEKSLPVRREVQGACDLLGLDPLYVANEGKALVLCPQAEVQSVLALLHSHPLGQAACQIGVVTKETSGTVVLETRLGGARVVEMPVGEQLPRIC